jgi:phosphatidylglycerophosphatase A
MRLHKLIASCFGIGFIKGGGSITAFVICVVWSFIYFMGAGTPVDNMLLPFTSILIVVGIWSSTEVQVDWGKDSSRVVIDEAAGMCITLLFIPEATTITVILAFVLFRFFDILKPLYIRRAEALPGGWGVMMDDVLAGIYSNLVLQGIIYIGIL